MDSGSAAIPTGNILSLAVIARRLGVSRTTVFREIRRKNLPTPIRVSAGRVGIPEEQFNEVLAARIRAASGEAE